MATYDIFPSKLVIQDRELTEQQIHDLKIAVQAIFMDNAIHVHLIPLHNMENARFTTKQKLSSTEFEVVASLIAKNYNEIG